MTTNHYDTLELSTKVSPDMIKQAYRTLSKRFHPDHNQNEGAELHYIAVQDAYEVLSDPQKKWEYDQTLEQVSTPISEPVLEQDWYKQEEYQPRPFRPSLKDPKALMAYIFGKLLFLSYLVGVALWFLITHIFDVIKIIFGLFILFLIYQFLIVWWYHVNH